MAYIKEYTDERGVIYINSFWKLSQININIETKVMEIMFEGYKDRAAKINNKDKIGTKTYRIEGSDFDKALFDETRKIRNLRTICYEWARDIKDVISENAQNPNAQSFFEGIVDNQE